MEAFDKLLAVAERLLGPGGCPWDVTQTFNTLQPYLLEEVHEVIEAVDSKDQEKIIEELGDLLYTIIFYCTIAKKEKKFTVADVLDRVREKLVFRHPHVFGEEKLETASAVMQEWEKRKLQEKAHEGRKSALDGIPASLPLLARAQKTVAKIMRKNPSFFEGRSQSAECRSEEEKIAEEFFALLCRAHDNTVDIEGAVRRELAQCEHEFRSQEN